MIDLKYAFVYNLGAAKDQPAAVNSLIRNGGGKYGEKDTRVVSSR